MPVDSDDETWVGNFGDAFCLGTGDILGMQWVVLR